MGTYKQKYNPLAILGFNFVPTSTILTFKEAVENEAALPPNGNTQGDARFATDTGHLYVWDGIQWVDQGDIIDYPSGSGVTIVQDEAASLDPDEIRSITHTSDPLFKRVVEILIRLQSYITEYFNTDTQESYDYNTDKVYFQDPGGNGVLLKESYGAEGMLAYYLFNDDEGEDIVSDSFGSHDGEKLGVTYGSGIVEHRADFDGASYIDIPNHTDFVPGAADMFAVEFWLKLNPPDGEIISLWNEADDRRSWRLYIDSNKLKLDISEDGITVAGTWELTNALNTYYNDIHIGFMRNPLLPEEIKVFINGIKTLPHSYPGAGAAYNNTVDPIRIGAAKLSENETPTNFFTGWISELAFYKNFNFDQPTGMYSNYFALHMGLNTIGQHLSMYDTTRQNIKTNDHDGQIDTSSWLGISSIGFNCESFGDYEISLLLSVDARATWNRWADLGGGTWGWEECLETDKGTDITSLPASSADWDLFFVAGTLDYILQIKTNDISGTPIVYQMIINTIQPGYMPAGWKATFSCLSDTETQIRNSTMDSGMPETIYDIKTNIVL